MRWVHHHPFPNDPQIYVEVLVMCMSIWNSGCANVTPTHHPTQPCPTPNPQPHPPTHPTHHPLTPLLHPPTPHPPTHPPDSPPTHPHTPHTSNPDRPTHTTYVPYIPICIVHIGCGSATFPYFSIYKTSSVHTCSCIHASCIRFG